MKIALVTDKFIYGGGLEHIYQLCKGLPEVQFGVFGKAGYAEHKFEDLKNVTLFQDYSKKSIKKFNPHWVHIHHLRPLLSLYNICFPTIFTVHGVHSHKFEFKKGLINFIKKKFRMSLEGFLYKRVDKVLFVSKEDEGFVKGNYEGLKSTQVIYNGIDFNRMINISDTKEHLISKLNYSKNTINILTVARFDFQKGYDILQKSLALIDRSLLNKFHFYFIGDGPLLAEQKALNLELDLSNVISFLGKKSNIGEYLKASDYFLLPSRWEGLPITLIEALSCNLPIIGSNTYGIREVAKLFPNVVSLVDFTDRNTISDSLNQLLNSKNDKSIELDYLKKYFGLQQMIDGLKKVYFG